jgi:hypothetical protein
MTTSSFRIHMWLADPGTDAAGSSPLGCLVIIHGPMPPCPACIPIRSLKIALRATPNVCVAGYHFMRDRTCERNLFELSTQDGRHQPTEGTTQPAPDLNHIQDRRTLLPLSQGGGTIIGPLCGILCNTPGRQTLHLHSNSRNSGCCGRVSPSACLGAADSRSPNPGQNRLVFSVWGHTLCL